MRITLSLDKSIEENASSYFERAKKQKDKLEGAKEALELTKRKLKKAQKESSEKQEEQKKRRRKPEWYESYRWFFSSEGILCIGGRNATTNERIIKKYTNDNDTVFHCDIAGSPFFLIRTEKSQEAGEDTLKEAAKATGSFSRAWKQGLGNVEVYAVKGEQLSKEAPSGEYLTKGAFMVRGKREFYTVIPKLAVARIEGRIMIASEESIKAHAKQYVLIGPGNTKSSTIAKEIRKKLGGDLDEILKALPAGGSKILQEVKG